MKIVKKGEGQSYPGPDANFTGKVMLHPIMHPPAPARAGSSHVHFEPGARTHWHSHPLGQTLHVVSGVGFIKWQGGPAAIIREGDSVWIGPDEIHAHGASPTIGMCHLTITERAEDGPAMFHGAVADDDYLPVFAAE